MNAEESFYSLRRSKRSKYIYSHARVIQESIGEEEAPGMLMLFAGVRNSSKLAELLGTRREACGREEGA